MNQKAKSNTATGNPIFDRGCHFAAGVLGYQRGDERKLPTYFTKHNHNAKAWLEGWDYGKVLTAPPGQQSFELFRANVMVINVHLDDDGTRKLGRALANDSDEVRQIREHLLREFERQSPGRAQARLEEFERTLAATSEFKAEGLILSGTPVRGKHLLLNAMLVTPPDLLERTHSFSVREAMLRGEPVHVPQSDEDPRDALLLIRQKALTPARAAT